MTVNKKSFRSVIAICLAMAMTVTSLISVPFVFADDEQDQPVVSEETEQEVPAENNENDVEQGKSMQLNEASFPALKISAVPVLDPKTKAGQHPYATATSGKLEIRFKPEWQDQAAVDALIADGWTIKYQLQNQNGDVLLATVAPAGTVYKISKNENEYKIVATATKGEETQTIESDVHPKYIFLDAPEDLTVSCPKKSNDVTVKWSRVKGAGGYYIYRTTKKTKKPTKPVKFVAEEKTTSYVDENRSGKKRYYYYVATVYREGTQEDPEYRTCSPLSEKKSVLVYRYLTCKVRAIGWKTKIKSTTKLYKGKTGGATKGTVKKGTRVEVTAKYPAKIPQQARPSRIFIKYKKGGKTKKGWVSYGSCTGVSGVVAYKKRKALDWTADRKEEFVNSKDYDSPTSYLVWVSTYTQRVNVFKGKEGKWELVRSSRCTTGNFLHLTKIGSGFEIWKRMPKRVRTFVGGTGTYWYKTVSFFSKGNSFHGVCYRSGSNKQINKVRPTLQPATKGCCRMADANAAWIYNNVPMKTKVVVR